MAYELVRTERRGPEVSRPETESKKELDPIDLHVFWLIPIVRCYLEKST